MNLDKYRGLTWTDEDGNVFERDIDNGLLVNLFVNFLVSIADAINSVIYRGWVIDRMLMYTVDWDEEDV